MSAASVVYYFNLAFSLMVLICVGTLQVHYVDSFCTLARLTCHVYWQYSNPTHPDASAKKATDG